MKKIVSYRQKLLELSRIYQVNEILNNKSQLTTYDIEILLLKNNVPIPSRQGYLSLKISREIIRPFFSGIKNFFIGFFNIFKPLNRLGKNIKHFFVFIYLGIKHFFKLLFNGIINFLNNIYNFKVKENVINKVISRLAYVSVIIILGFGVFYLKEFASNLDLVKFSFEIISDKSKNNKDIKVQSEYVINKKIKKPESEKFKEKKNKDKDIANLPKNEKIKTSEKDTYELNAATVVNLFEDLEYNLSKVRDDKKIQPIFFTRLPKDIDSIKSSKIKKDLFIQIVLPLIVSENERIFEDRNKLFKITSKKMTTDEEKSWLRKKLREYKVKNSDMKELKKKMDIIPVSIALAQAAKESGWGTSRFALEGNAIFGQWTWNGKGIKPLETNKDQTHSVLKFPILRASVKAYITNLNTHNGYKNFREKRSKLRKSKKQLVGLDLIHELDNYAQTGKKYTKILEKIIKQNSLNDFETVSVLDNKDKKQFNL